MASATIPTISSSQKTLIAVDTILIMLRLSLLRTHTTERIRPSRTKTILAPAQAVRTPSDSERCRSDGARAASGRMLPDRGFFAGLYCLLHLDRLEQKAKLYYGNYCCKTDFDLIRKIKALVSN